LGADKSLLEALDVLIENLLVTHMLFHIYLAVVILQLAQLAQFLRMNELATHAVRAVLIFVKLLAQFGLVPRRNMFLFLKLVLAVGKCASRPIRATFSLDPTLAELGLNLQFVVPGHDSTVSFESERIINPS
jgi:hypothetical protein